ncbi:FAD-binding oxidoreductase [Arthrobacter sp. R1-13]
MAGVRWGGRNSVPVSVRGAGTRLAGGAVAYPRGLVISLAEMNAILSVDPGNRLAEVQPGVITADIDAAATVRPDPATRAAHLSIKKAFDPQGILTPGRGV